MLLDLLFPKRCAYCRRIVGSDVPCCPKCRAEMPGMKQPLCRTQDGSADRVYCAVWYDGFVPNAIGQFKFYGKSQLAAHFAELMMERMGERLWEEQCDLIACVPMHRKKQRARGYNQAELLAKELSKRLGVPCKPLLAKNKDTREQHKLSGKDRLTNLKGTYVSKVLSGQKILLVDDVSTSGATMRECAAALKQAGASAVIGAAIALTPRHEQSVQAALEKADKDDFPAGNR